VQYTFVDLTIDSLGIQKQITEVKRSFNFVICYRIKLSLRVNVVL